MGKNIQKLLELIKKHFKSKSIQKGKGSTSAILSDITSLMYLFEYTLCFHAFCHDSSTLPSELRHNVNVIDYGGRSLISYFMCMIYRGDNSLDSRTTKVHTQLRTGRNFDALKNLMHANCSLGERLLKTEAKGVSKTAQMRPDCFIGQTCSRIQDKMILNRFFEVVYSDRSEKTTRQENTSSDRLGRKQPHFFFRRTHRIYAVDRKGKTYDPSISTGTLHPFVINALEVLEPNINIFDVYNEVLLRGCIWIRAFPNYRQSGPWFDYVNIKWEDYGLIPARVLCFYKKEIEEEKCELMALVHSCRLSLPNNSCSVKGFSDTVLTSHWKLEYSNDMPLIRSVSVEAIEQTLLCVQHCPTQKLFDVNNASFLALRPQNEWCYAWLAWNEVLLETNGKFDNSSPLNLTPLSSPALKKKVIANLNKKLLMECIKNT